MSKRMISIAIAVVVIFILYWYWNTHRESLDNGTVTSTDPAARMNSGGVDLDGKPMPENALSSTANNAADTGVPSAKSNSTAATGSTAASGSVAASGATAMPRGPVTTVPINTPVAVSQPYQNVSASPADLPTGDTLSVNAPSGMAFGGSGKFQWYRQGNLTWRINTRSGTSCIAFATIDEWQKPIVYQHGCGNA